jgi:mannitol 2-dehydrogenase
VTEPIPLRPEDLDRLPADVSRPTYDRRALTGAIVHMSVGGFHRAHQAVYLDDLLRRGDAPGWGICGVGLLPQDARMRDVLRAQDCLYTVVERDAGGDRARVIGAMREYLLAPDDPLAVIQRMAAPECKIVSLTITEGGYFVDPGTGELDEGDPDIRHDLGSPHAPRTAFGLMAEALEEREQRGLDPFTIQSCDNLQGNGQVARRTFLAFLDRRNPDLREWVEEDGSFPNAMVDRITPRTTDEDRALVRNRFGIDDGWPVVCEPFRQWVIEDRFPLGRPAWERAGAQLVADVHPFEMMKIRLLNGGHQAICWPGLLLGHRYTDDAMGDPDVRKLLERFHAEVTPHLPAVPGIDLVQYRRTLADRFSNPVLRDQLARIAADGSDRMPKFVLPSILDALARGGSVRALVFAVAAWFRVLAADTDAAGAPLPKSDPLFDELVRRARAGGEEPAPLLELRALFGDVLPREAAFVEPLRADLRSLVREGPRAALRRFLALP